MTILFLISAGVLLQTYLGYPISLVLLRLLHLRRRVHPTTDHTPSVTLVISAYNEEAVIRAKVENSLALDYPESRLERVVVSDGSTDRTESIVEEFRPRGVQLRSFKGRQGKVACLNRVVPDLNSDLVVMSDANSMYAKDSLRKLAGHFVDGGVGCVCGRLDYANPTNLIAGHGERLYWKYEEVIKRLESSLGALLGANGAIYAYRKELFRPVDPLMFCDDVIPIRIALRGYRVIYDPDARCTERAVGERVEMKRRSRHASFGMRSMLRMAREAIGAGRFLVLYQCLSHRVLRWMGGPAVLGLLVSSPFLPEAWLAPIVAGEVVFCGAGALGFFVSRLGYRVLPLYLPFYWLATSLAGLRGLIALVLRRDVPFWEPRQ